MTGTETHRHIPVMLEEVLQTLSPTDGEIYVDGTFGAGGYTRAILNAADCRVCVIDRDPEAILRAEAMKREFGDRLIIMHGCFGDVKDLLAAKNIATVDGFVLDLGVSSIQLSTAGRGFSFMHEGPLDMRMSLEGESARDVVMTASEEDLADIIFHYGEEKASRRIARAIVEARKTREINTTKDLVHVIHSVIPRRGDMKTDPATRTFQALRIHVNDELGEVERALDASLDILADGGRLVVVSFHSLEDWRVKNFLREQAGRTPNVSRHMAMAMLPEDPKNAAFDLPSAGGLKPSTGETAVNPRARSARLRYGIRRKDRAAGAKAGRHA